MMKKESKTADVLCYLNSHKGITSLEAFEKFGATRLSAIIYELKHRYGCEIESKIVKKKDRYGNTCHVAQYSIVK